MVGRWLAARRLQYRPQFSQLTCSTGVTSKYWSAAKLLANSNQLLSWFYPHSIVPTLTQAERKQLCQNDYGEIDFVSNFNKELIHMILVKIRIKILAIIILKTNIWYRGMLRLYSYEIGTMWSQSGQQVFPKLSQSGSKLSQNFLKVISNLS